MAPLDLEKAVLLLPPPPTRHITRIMRRRPLLTLIALGTCTVTLGMLFLSLASDSAEYSWSYLPFNDQAALDDFVQEPHLPHYLTDPLDQTVPPQMIAHAGLHGECLEAWVARGEICKSGPALDQLRKSMREAIPIDAVWTWVNGSDPRHRLSRDFWANKPVNHSIHIMQAPDPHFAALSPRSLPPDAWIPEHEPARRPFKVSRAIRKAINGVKQIWEWASMTRRETKASKWFRDHDELRSSMRSVKTHLPSLRTMHLIATDFQHPFTDPNNASDDAIPESVGFADLIWTSDDETGAGWREGQWPQWMDPSSFLTRQGAERTPDDGGVSVHHHWNIFSLPPDGGNSRDNWKNRVLPTFNSFAIESQLMNLPGLGENFIYNNDDFFFGRDLSTSDFYSPLFGPVFRMQSSFGVDPVEFSGSDPSGEWPQLHRSNWVLSNRFGSRKRPYIAHASKTFNLPILQETRLMFREALVETSMHRFRGLGHDVVAVFLTSHLVVERHREALLWSFLVARGDANGDGYLDEWELGDLLDVVAGDAVTQILSVSLPLRNTLVSDRPNKMLDAATFPRPSQTKYKFSSRDGYANYRPRPGSWPGVYQSRKVQSEYCKLDLPRCFPEAYREGGKVDASTLMQRIAFDDQDCGDCLIFQLMGAAGPSGLAPFLPPNTSVFPAYRALPVYHVSTSDEDGGERKKGDVNENDFSLPPEPEHNGTTPFLPLAPYWQGLDYTLENVQGITDWPEGSSRREFAMKLIQRYSYVMADTSMQFISLQRPKQSEFALKRISRLKPALICINDDIMNGKEEIEHNFGDFLTKMFPDRLPFEL